MRDNSVGTVALIWVRDAQLAKYFDLKCFHPRRIAVADMVVSQQVQDSVHQKMGHVIGHRLALFSRFARAGVIGDCDVSEADRAIRVGGRCARRMAR